MLVMNYTAKFTCDRQHLLYYREENYTTVQLYESLSECNCSQMQFQEHDDVNSSVENCPVILW